MIKWWRGILPLLALGLTGCVPFILESGTANFSVSEYSFPLADGNYALPNVFPKPADVANRSDHVEITLPNDEGTFTLIGGFIALKTPGHFIFQATGAMENGKYTTGEATYIPLRIAATGEVSWYTGPKDCSQECVTLLSAYGFRQDAPDGSWSQPKNLPRARMLAFYEELAAMLERNPEAWEAMQTARVTSL